jgi:AcrR family transcriptional regulator
MSKQARREQLIAAAMPILAQRGFADFSLEEIAARAGVTRNLLYHYFPRGRQDVVVAVVDRAGQELSSDWVLDEELPISERLAANANRMLGHALVPTDAWRIHRRARAAQDPEIEAIVGRYVELVISFVSLNHLGTPKPPRLVHLALTGYVAFFETTLDQARAVRAPRARVMQLLADTLVATISAAIRPVSS